MLSCVYINRIEKRFTSYRKVEKTDKYFKANSKIQH